MTRAMYDGIDAARLPAGGDLYAGYVDGKWPSANSISARFPHAPVVRIATSPGTNDGVVLDCEPGDATPEQAVNWVLMRRHAGVDPTVYCGQSAWPAARAAFATHDVPEPHWWVARYGTVTAIPAGAVALQHTSTAGYDVSAVADYWPGVDPAPAPPAAPAAPTEEIDMLILYVAGTAAVYALSGGVLWHVADQGSLESYQKAGIRSAHVSQAELAAIRAAAGSAPAATAG